MSMMIAGAPAACAAFTSAAVSTRRMPCLAQSSSTQPSRSRWYW